MDKSLTTPAYQACEDAPWHDMRTTTLARYRQLLLADREAFRQGVAACRQINAHRLAYEHGKAVAELNAILGYIRGRLALHGLTEHDLEEASR